MEFQKGEAGQLNVSNTEDSLWTRHEKQASWLTYSTQSRDLLLFEKNVSLCDVFLTVTGLKIKCQYKWFLEIEITVP